MKKYVIVTQHDILRLKLNSFLIATNINYFHSQKYIPLTFDILISKM